MIAANLLELGASLQDGPELFGCGEFLWINVVVGLWDAIAEVVRFFLAESKVR